MAEKRAADPTIGVDSQYKRPRVDSPFGSSATAAEASSSVPDTTRKSAPKTGRKASASGSSLKGRPLSKDFKHPAKAKDGKFKMKYVQEQKQFKQFKQKVHKLLNHVLAGTELGLDFSGVGQIEDIVETLIDKYGLSEKQPVYFSEKYGIPAPPERPQLQQVSYSQGVTEIFLDIKTKGSQQMLEIDQIAARRHDEDKINLFVMPGVRKASSDPTRRHNLSLEGALEDLCVFLGQNENNVLVGNDIEKSYLQLLLRGLREYGLHDRFSGKVKGFVDTQKVFKQTHQGLKSYKLRNLVQMCLGTSYKSKDAEADAEILQQLFQRAKVKNTIKEKSSFSTEYALSCFQETLRMEQNLPGLENLFKEEPSLKKITEKIAGSGLTAGHLEKVYRDFGREGIKNVFTEKIDGKTRVTTNEAMISLIGHCFEQLLAGLVSDAPIAVSVTPAAPTSTTGPVPEAPSSTPKPAKKKNKAADKETPTLPRRENTVDATKNLSSPRPSTSSEQKSYSELYGIPRVPKRPSFQQVAFDTSPTEVFVEIKTRGPQQVSAITQIAIVKQQKKYNFDVLPDPANAAPGYRNDQRFNVLQLLCDVVDSSGNDVLVGHNFAKSHPTLLFRALHHHDLLTRFTSRIKGVVDVMKVFKRSRPQLKSHTVRNLVQHVLNQSDYKPQDAEADALVLQRLLSQPEIDAESKRSGSFSTQFAVDCFHEALRTSQNLPSFENLMKEEAMTKQIAEKIAGSGLNAGHLAEVFANHGKEGITNVFSELVDGKARIPVNKTSIGLIANYLEKHK